jgi:hypothetical protein
MPALDMFKKFGEALVIILDFWWPVVQIGAGVISSKGDSKINDGI